MYNGCQGPKIGGLTVIK